MYEATKPKALIYYLDINICVVAL